MYFVASPLSQIPFDRPVTWAELASYPLIVQSQGAAGRHMVFNYFKKRGLKPLIGAEVNNVELCKELARQNKGVALMFETNILEEVASGRLRIIQMEDGEIKMGAIDVLVNREERLSPAVESFLKVIKKHFNDTLQEIAPQ